MNLSINNINFEKHNILTQCVRVSLLSLFRIIPPAVSQKVFHRSSKDARKASRWAKSHKALEIMYTFPQRRATGKASLGDVFWQTVLSNPRAVRNRLKLIERLLRHLVIERSKEAKPVRILSLGSGSARSVFETIAALNGEMPVTAVLLDNSQSAIRFSQRLSKEIIGDAGHSNIKWLCAKTESLSETLTDYSPDIVEMVGLLDYFDDERAREMFRMIHQHLASNSWFVVSNVIPNIERPFVDRVVGWPLIYRRPEQLKNLLIEGGFNNEQVRLFIEPLKIYAIALCKKYDLVEG